MLYRKSAIIGLSFLDSKDFCLSNQFSRAPWQKHSVSIYLTRCQKKFCLASMIELKLIYNTSYICRSTIYEHFLARISSKVSLAFLKRIQPILEELQENITKSWKPLIIDRSKWCYYRFSFKFKRLIILSAHSVKNQPINEQKCTVLARCNVKNILYSYKKQQKCNSKLWTYHCSTCIKYSYQNCSYRQYCTDSFKSNVEHWERSR